MFISSTYYVRFVYSENSKIIVDVRWLVFNSVQRRNLFAIYGNSLHLQEILQRRWIHHDLKMKRGVFVLWRRKRESHHPAQAQETKKGQVPFLSSKDECLMGKVMTVQRGKLFGNRTTFPLVRTDGRYLRTLLGKVHSITQRFIRSPRIFLQGHHFTDATVWRGLRLQPKSGLYCCICFTSFIVSIGSSERSTS